MNSSYALMTVDDTLALISLFILTLFLSFRALHEGAFRKVTPFTGIVFLFAAAHLFTMILKGETSTWGAYFRQLCLLLCAYCYIKTTPFDSFCKQYLQFLKLVSYASLILFFYINVLDITEPFPIYVNTNNVTYLSIYLAFAQENAAFRCMGPFWEPAIFASFLIMGIILECCFVNRPTRWYNVILFSFMVFMTFSTGGYVLLVVTYLIVLNQKSSWKISTFLNYFVLLSCFVLFFFFDDLIELLAILIPSVFNKVTWQSVSMMTRLNNPLVDLIIWKKSPWVGVGIRSYQSEWLLESAKYIIGSRTSTLTYYPATIGLGGFLYPLMVYRCVMRQKNLSIVVRLSLLLIYVCILTKEPHYNSLFMLLFIMYFNTNKPETSNHLERNAL
ncbi:MAG: hypothetical protein IJN20_00980 [Oscillospiraceae bacterium]|nr:hypothetical protein [Oscillospiraceae bacterium]